MTGTLVLLQSYPRSGNTLVRHVIEDYYGVPTYTVYPDEGKMLWPDRHIDDENMPTDPVVFVKTHEERDYSVMEHKTLYIVRDGRDALISHAHFLCKFNGSCGSEFRDRLTELVFCKEPQFAGHGKSPTNDWGAHVIDLMQQADAVLRFEDLLIDPVAEVREALKAVGVLDKMPQLPSGTMPDFAELHDRHPNFYRKGTTGQWRDEFPPDLLEAFWYHHGKAMKLAGYKQEMPAWA